MATEEISIDPQDVVHLSRLALAGRIQDVQTYIQRMQRRYRTSVPALAEGLKGLLDELPSRSTPLRGENPAPVPVDIDTRLQLVRYEIVPDLEVEPVYSQDVWGELRQVVLERQKRDLLTDAGLVPIRTALFTGSPGVGKSLGARWIASQLDLPLLVLDLAAVMSSFLGRTGTNVRRILDYAKEVECILLIDELDAVAKRRDDATEIGELKRLVTVLLQEIDDWPPGSLLIAATNHPRLLDPAIWRRFEVKVEFPMPSLEAIAEAVERFMGPDAVWIEDWIPVVSAVLQGMSFSEVELEIRKLRRSVVLNGGNPETRLVQMMQEKARSLGFEERRCLAMKLVGEELVSQRKAHDITGLARDTIRKAMRDDD